MGTSRGVAILAGKNICGAMGHHDPSCGLCILNFGPGNREFLIAVDKVNRRDSLEGRLTGRPIGTRTQRSENDGNANDFTSDEERSERLRGSWNTPIIVQVDGHSELMVALPRRVSAFNPSTGERLWTCGDGAPLAYASLME